jgi:hypothetical protein
MGFARRFAGGNALEITGRGLEFIRRNDDCLRYILRAMGRPTTRESVRQIIDGARVALPGGDVFSISYIVAGQIVKAFFGLEWLEKHILDVSAPTDFFKNDWADDTRRNMHVIRVIHLAEMLVNLKQVPGFHKIKAMMEQGDIEASYAEMEVGKLVAWSKHPFRFCDPTGQRGTSYDLEILFPGNRKACAETKCKLEDTPRGEATLLNSLMDNRNQLPANEPGIFFVKLPQSWNQNGDDDTHIQAMERVATQFMRGTGRVVSVKFYFSLALDFAGDTASIILFKDFTNRNHRFDRSIDWAFPVIEQPESWVDIIRMCSK